MVGRGDPAELIVGVRLPRYSPAASRSLQCRRSSRAHTPGDRTLDRDAWLKALRGQARYDSIVGAIAGRVRTIAVDGKNKIVSRLRGEDRNEPKLAKRFRTLLERNSTVVLVYSKEDAGLDHLKLQVGDYLAALRAKDNFKLVLMDGKDYTFAATVSQDQLKEVVSSFMISRFI